MRLVSYRCFKDENYCRCHLHFLGFKLQKFLRSTAKAAEPKALLRFEPSSRTALIGEQPNPWELLHPQDAMSRHRGSDPRRRYGRSGATTLLSPG